jgi:hypothetical protein
MILFFGYEELGRLLLGGGRGHDEEEEAWFGPAESKTEEDDADREPTAFYILCFSPGSDLSALFVGAGRGGKERGFVSEPAAAVLARGDRAGSCDVSTASDLCSRLPCRRGLTPWLARSSPAACACPPAAGEEVKKRQANDSLLHGDVDKAIDHWVCLVGENWVKSYCSIFRCYLIKFV